MGSVRGLLESPSRRLILTALLAFVITLVAVAGMPGGAQAALDSEEQAFLTAINSHRQANGLGSLSLDSQLTAAADWMSNDMAANDYFSHTDSLGRDPFQRMADFGYSYSTWKGENLAAGVDVAQAAFNVFKNSPGHNSNMLNPNFKVIGIGRAYGAGTTYGWYWTTDFGGQGSPPPPPAPTTSPPAPTSPGSLLSGAGPEIYVMRDGIKRHIPNRVTLEAMGFEWGNVSSILDSSLAAIPTGDPLLDAEADGNLLKGSSDGVYVMEGGLKRHVVSRSVMASCGYGWDAVYVIPDSSLGSIPTGVPLSGPPCPKLSPPSGNLLSGAGPEIYLMSDGIKRHIPNRVTFEAMGFEWGNINAVPESSLASIASGDALLDVLADGNLLVGSGPELYVMEGGLKRHVVSRSVVDGCGYGWDAVHAIPDSLLGSMPTGASLGGPPCPKLSFAVVTLLSGSGPEVYVMEGGIKRHITSRDLFGVCGYLWGNINPVPDSVLAGIPTGESLIEAPCP